MRLLEVTTALQFSVPFLLWVIVPNVFLRTCLECGPLSVLGSPVRTRLKLRPAVRIVPCTLLTLHLLPITWVLVVNLRSPLLVVPPPLGLAQLPVLWTDLISDAIRGLVLSTMCMCIVLVLVLMLPDSVLVSRVTLRALTLATVATLPRLV